MTLRTGSFVWTCSTAIVILAGRPAFAWTNLLKDPGFEEYQLDPRGFYAPRPDAGWKEITMGRCSVQFNANSWKAPAEMLAERPLGFTPGTSGFEGMGPTENKGKLIWEQDILDPALSTGDKLFYEAWIWLGGAGRDNDKEEDTEDEWGGWQLYFYDNTDTAKWKESNAIQVHSIGQDYHGDGGTFVQLVGYGKIPPGAKAARMRVWASTYGQASQAAKYDTEVAVDNAHFAILGAPNMLINGDFEMDDREGEMKGWMCPAAWPFGRNGMRPRDVNNAFGDNFDHSSFLPFFGGRWAYGYCSYLDGWRKDGFSFSQYADYRFPQGTPLVLMFNWFQNVAYRKTVQLRTAGTELEMVFEYLRGRERLDARAIHLDWPVPKTPGNSGGYDQNDGLYCPRILLNPPVGTDRVGLHVNFIVNTPNTAGRQAINAVVDDFYLGPVDLPQSARAAATGSSTAPAETR